MAIPHFEITAADIGALRDDVLRQLVARLCRAEVVAGGATAASVTSGGHQDAPDGGVDVRVAVDPGTAFRPGYIPRRQTIIQVKATGMRPATIRVEMSHGAEVRPVIAELVASAGAYMIVCSAEDPSDAALQQRQDAMRGVLEAVDPGNLVAISFLGREQIATWVNQYPSCQLWLLECLGRNHTGWRPFDGWAGWQGDWLHDETPVMLTPTSRTDEVPTLRGLEDMRTSLRTPGSCVRLAGLSGVGKTRFIQALFENVGAMPLDQHRVLYADAGNPPLQPSPHEVIQACAADQWQGVIVIDDCNPAAHRQIEQALRRSGAPVSVVTIEYDVSEDEPEATAVYRLSGCSEDQLLKLLETRFDGRLTFADRLAICRVAGGNVRLAFAIAQGPAQAGSLARLTDRQLYKRLFFQRGAEDPELERTAQAASIVFSFSCENTERGQDERPFLAALVGQTPQIFSDNLRRLIERQLCQRRTQWRAVLPHALSNRLASELLVSLGAETIRRAMEGAGQRLLNSFTKRLEHLHDSPEAQAIARAWLAPDGLLGSTSEWTKVGVEWFDRVAPLDPAATLACIEARVAAGLDDRRTDHGRGSYSVVQRTLQAIAYDPELFPRAALALSEFLLRERVEENNNSIRDAFFRLFWPSYSGTHASVDQRLALLQTLARGCPRSRELSAKCLLALMGAHDRNTVHLSTFGYRKRDLGSILQSEEALDEFQAAVHEVAERWMSDGDPMSPHLQQALLARLRAYIKLRDRYVPRRTAILLKSTDPVFRYALNARASEVLASNQRNSPSNPYFESLCQQTAPATIGEELLTFINSDVWERVRNEPDDDGGFSEKQREAIDHVTALARQIANDTETLNSILPALVKATGHAFAAGAGRGLASGASAPIDLWRKLLSCSELAGLTAGSRIPAAIVGFFGQAANENREVRREMVVELGFMRVHPAWRVGLLGQVPWIGEDLPELVALVEDGANQPEDFYQWDYSWSLAGLAPDARSELLHRLRQLPRGTRVAFRLIESVLNRPDRVEPLDAFDRDTLEECVFAFVSTTNDVDHEEDYRLRRALDLLASTPSAPEFFGRLSRALAEVLPATRGYLGTRDEHLIARMIMHAPVSTFSDLIEPIGEWMLSHRIETDHTLRAYADAFSVIDLRELMAWVRLKPVERAPLVAAFAPMTIVDDVGNPEAVVIAPWAAELLDVAPDKVSVLESFQPHRMLSGWSGSYAEAMKPRRAIVENLCSHPDPAVAAWAWGALVRLDEKIAWRSELFAEDERAAREAFE